MDGMPRIMALDYGDARTGVALSDPTGTLAGITTVVRARTPQSAAEQIAGLVRQYQPDTLVLGLPRNMDGSEGPRAALCRDFAVLLHTATGLEPVLWDERRTTIQAQQILHANGKNARKQKKNIDAVAAALILESYLARSGGSGGK